MRTDIIILMTQNCSYSEIGKLLDVPKWKLYYYGKQYNKGLDDIKQAKIKKGLL